MLVCTFLDVDNGGIDKRTFLILCHQTIPHMFAHRGVVYVALSVVVDVTILNNTAVSTQIGTPSVYQLLKPNLVVQSL